MIACEKAPEITPEIVCEKTEVVIPVQGTEEIDVFVEFNSNVEWTAAIKEKDTWCNITPKKGDAGDVKIKVLAEANPLKESRAVTLVITAETAVKEVSLVQSQLDAFELLESSAAFGPEGGNTTIKVNTNVAWDITIPSDCKWVKVVDSKAYGEQTKTLAVDPYNEYDTSREAKITVKGGNFEPLTYTITQDGPVTHFELVSNEAYIESEGGSFDITVNTNIEWTVTIPEDCDWIKPAGTKADGQQTKTFTVSPYKELDAYREAELLVKGGKLEPIVFTVTQYGIKATIWYQNVTGYADYQTGQKARLAKYGDNLLLLNGNQVYVIDPATGKSTSTIKVPGDMVMDGLCVDDANHILVSSDASYGGDVVVYRVDDINNINPQEYIRYSTLNYYGVDTGNIRVKGDITKNAVVTACVSDGAGGAMLAWKIADGKLDTWYYSNVPYAGSTILNCCAVPCGPTFSDGFYYIGYGGDYNLKYLADFKTDSGENVWANAYTTGSFWMENYNCITTATWNGKKYAAILKGCHFNYDATDVVLLDVTEPASAKEVYAIDCDGMVSRSDAWENLDWTGAGTFSDVLLVPTDKALEIYYVDANFNVIGCSKYYGE